MWLELHKVILDRTIASITKKMYDPNAKVTVSLLYWHSANFKTLILYREMHCKKILQRWTSLDYLQTVLIFALNSFVLQRYCFDNGFYAPFSMLRPPICENKLFKVRAELSTESNYLICDQSHVKGFIQSKHWIQFNSLNSAQYILSPIGINCTYSCKLQYAHAIAIIRKCYSKPHLWHKPLQKHYDQTMMMWKLYYDILCYAHAFDLLISTMLAIFYSMPCLCYTSIVVSHCNIVLENGSIVHTMQTSGADPRVLIDYWFRLSVPIWDIMVCSGWGKDFPDSSTFFLHFLQDSMRRNMDRQQST